MRRWILVALLLLGGCGVHADESLIAISETPAGVTGHFKVFTAGDPEGLSRAQRKSVICIHSGDVADPAPTARRPDSFCSFEKEEDRGSIPRFADIDQAGSGYVLRVPNAPHAEDADMRFVQIDGSVWLMQLAQGGHYDLWVVRMTSTGIELYLPSCEQFPNGTRPYQTFAESSCVAISLDAMRSELAAYAASVKAGHEIPLGFLQRI